MQNHIVSLLDFFKKRMKERKEEMCKNHFIANKKFTSSYNIKILCRL